MSRRSRRTARRLLLLAATFASAMLPPAAHAGSGFLPHRAVYAMTLQSVRGGSGIASASGQMAVQWEQDCHGWTFEHRSVMNLGLAEGDPLQLITQASSWESADSNRYSFSLRHTTNGKETERVEGAASLKKDGQGAVQFTRPKPQEFALPKGTLFPVAHSELVLKAAARGLKAPKSISRIIFDGMGVEGPLEANAVLTPPAGKAAAGFPALAGHKPFGLTIAYFERSAAEAEPKHEMAMRMYDSGVADELVIDFDDFTVHATLERLEMLTAPRCGN